MTRSRNRGKNSLFGAKNLHSQAFTRRRCSQATLGCLSERTGYRIADLSHGVYTLVGRYFTFNTSQGHFCRTESYSYARDVALDAGLSLLIRQPGRRPTPTGSLLPWRRRGRTAPAFLPSVPTIAAAAMALALPHSAWQPPSAPDRLAFAAITMPNAPAVKSDMTASRLVHLPSDARIPQSPGSMPQEPAVGAATHLAHSRIVLAHSQGSGHSSVYKAAAHAAR